MTLNEIMEIANKAYPDAEIEQHWDVENQRLKPGLGQDGLAEFIVRELRETYDEAAGVLSQLETAEDAMLVGACELTTVANAFGAVADPLWIAANQATRLQEVISGKAVE